MTALRILLSILLASSALACAPSAAASPFCTDEQAPKDHALVHCLVWCGHPGGEIDPMCLRDGYP